MFLMSFHLKQINEQINNHSPSLSQKFIQKKIHCVQIFTIYERKGLKQIGWKSMRNAEKAKRQKSDLKKQSLKINRIFKCKRFSDESGIRTHASEETGALNQRLRPLGHLACCYSNLKQTLYTE